MASLEAIHVHPFLKQVSEKEKKTLNTSGLFSESTSKTHSLTGYSLKMSTVTSPLVSTPSLTNYSDLVTKYKLAYSQRMNAEIEKDKEHHKNEKDYLYLDVKKPLLWATPNTLDYVKPRTREQLSEKAKQGGCKNLREDVINPALNTTGSHRQQENSTAGKSPDLHRLNANWVESLQGLPVGWTQLPTALVE